MVDLHDAKWNTESGGISEFQQPQAAVPCSEISRGSHCLWTESWWVLAETNSLGKILQIAMDSTSIQIFIPMPQE